VATFATRNNPLEYQGGYLDDEIKALVLLKIHKEGTGSGGHPTLDNLQEFQRRELSWKAWCKKSRKIARDLIRAGWIIPKPKGYGLQALSDVFLKREISQLIQVEIRKK
jgi:hypothetical protein